MEWILLAIIVALALIIVVVGFKLLKVTMKLAVWLILNALGGLFILLVSNLVFNLGIPYDTPTLVICAVGGVPGAVGVDILALMGTYL